MDNEKNWQILLEILNRVLPGVIVVIAGAIIYFFFNLEILKGFINLLVPLAIYAVGLGTAYFIRRRKEKFLAVETKITEVNITLNYFVFFWHDALVFLTPSIIILMAYWLKGEVAYFDVIASAIAMTGLYLSELIYKRKII